MNLIKTLGLATIALGLAAPALAHHSFAMFDSDKTLTMAGTVKEFEWVNPHSWMHITIQDAATGKPADYSFEMGSPGQLGSKGMKPDSVRPGDKVTIRFHPLKDGTHGGQYMSVTLADGKVWGNPGNAPAGAAAQ
jgi:hypothetical protein